MWTGELGEIKQSLKVMKKYNSALDICGIKKGIYLENCNLKCIIKILYKIINVIIILNEIL